MFKDSAVESLFDRSVMCDNTGHFEIKDAVSGQTYSISSYAENYVQIEWLPKPVERSLLLVEPVNNAHPSSIQVEPGKTLDVGKLILQPTGKAAESATPALTNLTPVDGAEVKAVIGGIVVDEAGKPVADAKVTIQSQDLKVSFKKESRSGTDGRFTIALTEAGINPDELAIFVTHPNCGIYSNYCSTLPEEGMNLSNCRIVMSKRGFIQGKVVDAMDKPVKDADIKVLLSKKVLQNMQPSSIQLPYNATLNVKTDAKGTFKLDGLPYDVTLIVAASHPDFVIGFAGLPERRHDYVGTIAVGSTDILIKLQPGATVEGKVTWEGTGAPARHVFVGAFPEDVFSPTSMMFQNRVETDDNGVFVIKGVAPGKCILKQDCYLAGIILPRTVEVAQGAKLTGQDLTVIKGIRVAGKFIKGSTKGPVGGGHVYATLHNGEQLSYFDVKPDGTFEGHMLPGVVTIHARIPNASLSPSEKQLTLVAGHDQTDLVFEVGPQLVFKGRVIGADGNPIAGAIVFSKLGGVTKPAYSDQNGRFDCPLSSDISLNKMDVVIFEARHPDQPGLRGILEKRIGNEKDLTGDIVMGPTGTIRGKIVDINGKPVPSAEIATFIALKNATMNDLNADCDQEGWFEIKEAIPGKTYDLLAMAEKIGRVESNTFSMEAGATWDVGTLILQPTDKTAESVAPASTDLKPVEGAEAKADIAGIVVDEVGNPVADASVVVQKYRPIGNKTLGKILAQEETISGSDGKFSLRLSRNETRFLMFTTRHPDYGISIRSDFKLGEDKKDLSNCRIVMAKRGTIQGKVVDIANKPVENAEITVFLVKNPDPDTTCSPLLMPDKSLFSTKTGADGTFTLDGLPQDSTVIIRASHPDYAIGIVGRAGNNIAVGSTNVIFTLKPGATIEGKIIWEGTDVPVAHVPVCCWFDKTSRTDTIGLPDPVETDDQGAFQIKGLESGSYEITSFFNEGLIVPKSVDVDQAAKMTGQNLTATKGVMIAGEFVRTDTKEPLQVELYARSKNNLFQSTWMEGTWMDVKPDGTFSGRVMPGETILQAKVKNGSPIQQEKTLTLVKGQDQMDLVFEVKMSPKLKVRVLDTNNKPVAGAKVLFIKGADEGPATTNKDGICEYFVPPFINFQSKVTYPVTFEASHPDKPELHGMLTKEITREADLICDIVLAPVGIIRGKVADISGKPVPSAKVIVYTEENGRIDHETTCDATGQFEIKDVITGVNYSVKAKAGTAWIKTDPKILKPGATWDVGVMTLP